MPKVALNVAIFGTFLIIVAVLGVFLWQTLFASEEHAQPQAETKPAYSQQGPGNENALRGGAPPRAHNPTEEAIANYTKWLAIFTLFLVLATVALFISGERNVEVAGRSAAAAKDAADAAKESVDLARVNSEIQLRAYVVVGELITLAGNLEASAATPITSWKFVIRWKNTGLTPAQDFRANTDVLIFGPEGMPDVLDHVQEIKEAPSVTIGASQAQDVGDFELDMSVIQAVKEGKLRLYIWTSGSYRDVFKGTPRRNSNFSAEIKVTGDIARPGGPFALLVRKQHFRTD